MTSTRSFALLTACLAALGCAPQGLYIWADDYRLEAPPSQRGYVILVGDQLNVRVFNQENMSGEVRVRQDGKISLPFLNDVDAAGITPVVLTQRIQSRLKEYINNPVVTVVVMETRPIPISVVGQVTRPGVFTLEPGSGVLQAIASAGGFTEWARQDRIFVLRANPRRAGKVDRIRFRYDTLTRGEGRSPLFALQANDIVVVE